MSKGSRTMTSQMSFAVAAAAVMTLNSYTQILRILGVVIFVGWFVHLPKCVIFYIN
jgi:hypothetical protein